MMKGSKRNGFLMKLASSKTEIIPISERNRSKLNVKCFYFVLLSIVFSFGYFVLFKLVLGQNLLPKDFLLSYLLTSNHHIPHGNRKIKLEDDVMRFKVDPVKLSSPSITTDGNTNLRIYPNSVEMFNKHYDLKLKNPEEMIIGLAPNSDFKSFAVFITSLRETANSDASMIIFMPHPISTYHHSLAEKYEITLIDYDKYKLKPTFLQKYHPTTLRWIFYYELFSKNAQLFTTTTTTTTAATLNSNSLKMMKILLMDIQDVSFQMNPFPLLTTTDHDDHYSQKDKFIFKVFTISYQKDQIQFDNNLKKGFHECFNQEEFNRIKYEKPLTNSVIYGNYPAIFSYLTIFHQILLNTNDHDSTKIQSFTSEWNTNNQHYHGIIGKIGGSHFPSCEQQNIDDVIHNYIIYSKNLLSFTPKILSSQYSLLTPLLINLKNAFNIFPGHGDFIYSPESKQKYAILHQYDAIPGFSLKLVKKYLPHIHWNDPLQSEWEEIPSCDAFTTIYHYDVLGNRCDLSMKTNVLNAASCCELCTSYNAEQALLKEEMNLQEDLVNCTSFTYYNNVCYLKSCSLKEIDERLIQYDHFKLISTGSSIGRLEGISKNGQFKQPNALSSSSFSSTGATAAASFKTPSPSSVFLAKKNLLFAYLGKG